MQDEMAEQPGVVARLLERRADIAACGAGGPQAQGVALLGRGSSEHAAAFGAGLFDRPAVVLDPALLDSAAGYRGWLAVGISQSGETPGIGEALARLGEAGARTVAVTNDISSPLAQAADAVVDLMAGEERAVPATKTFTASLAALLLLAGIEGVDDLPAALADVLADRESVARVADRLAWHEGWACVGDGLSRPIAAEAALKLEEAALVVADHHSAVSFRHGPIATAGPHRPVVVFGAPGLADELRHLGSPVVLVDDVIDADLTVPRLSDPLAAVAAAVRAQQLALSLALRRGANPDRPPHLHKVTLA